MDYNEIIKFIQELFNKQFGTSYNIEYNLRQEILKFNPKFNIGEKAAGFYDTGSRQIYIFSDVIDKIRLNNLNKNYDQGLTYLIHAVFHELQHRIQQEHPEILKKQSGYSMAMYDIENLIMKLRGIDEQVLDIDYKKMHDMFLLEIDADTRGVNNAKGVAKHYGLKGINMEYYDLMEKYNKFREDNYDIPVMINQLIRIVNKYPSILSDKRWLDNDELVNFFDSDGKIKPVEELRNIPSKFTKYFVTSEEFLTQNNLGNMNSQHKMFVNDCIKRVIAIREEKDRRIMDSDIEKVVEELNKYALDPNLSSKSYESMASQAYYNKLREHIRLIGNDEIVR